MAYCRIWAWEIFPSFVNVGRGLQHKLTQRSLSRFLSNGVLSFCFIPSCLTGLTVALMEPNSNARVFRGVLSGGRFSGKFLMPRQDKRVQMDFSLRYPLCNFSSCKLRTRTGLACIIDVRMPAKFCISLLPESRLTDVGSSRAPFFSSFFSLWCHQAMFQSRL